MINSLDTLVENDVNLQQFNTMNLSATAAGFIAITSSLQLQQLLQHPEVQQGRLLILGGGSNVLFADDFDGLVLHMEIKGKEVVKETEREVWLSVGSGENWHQTVRYCVQKGWGGVENLSLIPGTVGAAPIQNIGAYGVELKDVFVSLKAVHRKTGEQRNFTWEECHFGYRESIFKNNLKDKYVITEVTLCLSKQPILKTTYGAIQSLIEQRGLQEPSIKDISDIVIEIRSKKLPDPDILGNTGSFFKNPIVNKKTFKRLQEHYPGVPGYSVGEEEIKVPAGWLIEQAGWKGKTMGQAGTYEKQALVIVNRGGATGKEILKLADTIKQSVHRKFGIRLTPEVNIIQ